MFDVSLEQHHVFVNITGPNSKGKNMMFGMDHEAVDSYSRYNQAESFWWFTDFRDDIS